MTNTRIKLSNKDRAALVDFVRRMKAAESQAGSDETNNLDEQHRFACRYAATILAGLAMDIADGKV